MKNALVILAVAIMLPGSAAAVDSFGQVQNENAFRQVHTFCVDTHLLSRDNRKAEEKFIKKNNKPGKLLGKLAWKYTEDCSKADAIMTLKFDERKQSEMLSTVQGTIDPLGVAEATNTFTKVGISVAKKTGADPFYTLEGEEVRSGRVDAIDKSFRKLDHDLKLKANP